MGADNQGRIQNSISPEWCDGFSLSLLSFCDEKGWVLSPGVQARPGGSTGVKAAAPLSMVFPGPGPTTAVTHGCLGSGQAAPTGSRTKKYIITFILLLKNMQWLPFTHNN